MQQKYMWKKIFIATGSVILGLLIAECILRIFNYPYIGCSVMRDVAEYTTGEFDPVLGWRYRPSSSKTFDGVPYIFNAEGYRVENILHTTDFSKPRVLIVGDSTLLGDGLPFEETFGYKLQQRVGNNYEVINAAVQGYGLDQIYLYLQQLLPKYTPVFVVIDLIEDQDYRDLLRDRRSLFPCYHIQGTKPLFEVQNNTLIQTHVPEKFETYDTPRLRLVWRRFMDAFRQERGDTQVLSKLLYQRINQLVSSHHASLLEINYQLDVRPYQQGVAPLVASYSGQYVQADGFHPTDMGTTKLTDDFMEHFGQYLK